MDDEELRPITAWSRFNKDAGRFEHNHIEDGHSESLYPIGVTDEQTKAWRKAEGWSSRNCYLDARNRVVDADPVICFVP